ncbi:MAG: glycoside hydrolase family 88/105 protein [Cetobacterium sp.]|uniref:glycoside hydrolase family 88/105 protein n=1 Tax=Cetobacterium sp. TaxID=2071632 RepID=UPI003F2F6AD3
MITKKQVIDTLYNRLITLEPIEGEYVTSIYEWEWQQGVSLYTTYKMYKMTGEKKYLDFILEWYDRMIKEGIPERNVNTTAPFLTMAFLAEDKIESSIDFEKYVKNHAEWIIKKFPLTTDGGFQHLTREYIHREQIWADTVYMTVLFLAKAGKYLNKKEYIDEAIYQAMVHIKYLTDTRTGLFYHGWSFMEEEKELGKYHWARGNSWITMGIPELLEIIGEDIDKRSERFLKEAYVRQVKILIDYQNNDGMWHTIITNRASYLETSATAALACGILKGVNLGLIDQVYYFNAFMGVRYIIDNYLESNGDLKNVSYGTPIGINEEHYMKIPFCQAPYGQTNMLLALIELKETENFHKGFTMPWKEQN